MGGQRKRPRNQRGSRHKKVCDNSRKNTRSKPTIDEPNSTKEPTSESDIEESPSKEQTAVFHGLYNQGATCYLNSVLQILFMTTEFKERLDAENHYDRHLLNLFENLEKGSCRTNAITATFGIQNVSVQCDAAECLEKILSLVSSEASEVFQGQLKHRTQCSDGHIVNEQKASIWTLPLRIEDQHYSLEEGVAMFFEPTSLSGDNLVYCDHCDGKAKAIIECEMEKCPQILTVLLNIFVFDYNTMSNFKIDCTVDLPRTLQIKNVKYQLYGMVNHFGSLSGGHYTATIQSLNNTWHDFNDSRVCEAQEELFARNSTHKSTSAYLIMYRRAPESQLPSESSEQSLPGHKSDYKLEEIVTPDEPGENVTEHNGNTGEELNRDTQTEYHVEDEISIALPKDMVNTSSNEAGLEMESLVEQKQHVDVEDEISIALPKVRVNASSNEAGLEMEPLLVEQRQHVEDEISIALPKDRVNASSNEAGLEKEPLIEQKRNSEEVYEKETTESKAEARSRVSTCGDSPHPNNERGIKVEERKEKKKTSKCCVLL